MPQLNILLEPDAALKGVDPDTVVFINTPVTVANMTGGMQSGKPSIMIIADLPDGKKAVIETSAELFMTAAEAFRTYYIKQGLEEFQKRHKN